MSRLHARLRRQQLEEEQAKAVFEALLASPTRAMPAKARSTGYDRQRARMLPLVGPAAGGGAQPGTRPGDAGCLRRIERDLRRKGRLG